MAELTHKQISLLWDEYREGIKSSTPVDSTETIEQKRKRIERLESKPEEWFKYYFPKFSYAEPANFHKAATRRVLNNPEWYEVRSWSRELAKSTRTMFEMLYLTLTKKKRYMLLISNSKDSASLLLEPYRAQLDSNPRIINDYGIQEKPGKWTDGDFTTKGGAKFKGIGAGQSPRGTRNDEARPDIIAFDDMDTDEDARNPEIIQKRWDWINDAAIGTRSISWPTLIIFCGNIIAKDCCVVRAQEFADHVDIINIRDNNGVSTWPQKNTEEVIDRVLSQKPYRSQQKEYYNNPITKGSIFDQMHYKHFAPVGTYSFLVCYIDLSYKDSKKNDYKFAVLMGKKGIEYHVLKAFGIQGSTSKLAEGLVGIEKWIAGKTDTFWVAEDNFLQDIIRASLQSSLNSFKSAVVVTPDSREKKEKITRIEAALEPLNRNGRLYLNEAEKNDPHMKLLEEQFTSLSYGNNRSHDDGPDAAEGAKFIIDQKSVTDQAPTHGRMPVRKHQL